jgi:putative transposase
MPRIARLDAPGVLHHVMIRGIEGRKIFRDNRDRKDFIERLAKLCPEMEIICYAWAFMPNHAHFLFRTGQEPLSKLMRRLLTGYVISAKTSFTRMCHDIVYLKAVLCHDIVYPQRVFHYDNLT